MFDYGNEIVTIQILYNKRVGYFNLPNINIPDRFISRIFFVFNIPIIREQFFATRDNFRI